ncbi:hypothetical protein [Phenylobacterium sp.]|uniref:IS66 family transposase n=1 Tax=Phenylobacterium sp. TaxID=1871053 RepID=UPI003FA69E51
MPNRERFGPSSQRTDRVPHQLELQLEVLEASASEDEPAAERGDHSLHSSRVRRPTGDAPPRRRDPPRRAFWTHPKQNGMTWAGNGLKRTQALARRPAPTEPEAPKLRSRRPRSGGERAGPHQGRPRQPAPRRAAHSRLRARTA